MSEERLQKILARAGIASRRAAEELILAGRVEINGEVVRELGTKAEAGRDQIRVDGKAIVEPEANVYFVLYKPERVVTTLSDPEGRACVGEYLRGIDERVFPVGRLDYDAEGVLLLTSDGGLAHKLTHPRWGVKRTYLAKVKGDPTPEVLERLVQGVRLDDGKARALEATFERSTEKNTWIRLVVAEGRPHLIKRLCEAVGHPVVRLFRSDYAGITVDGMKPGDLRPLLAVERRKLEKAVEKEAPLPPGGIPRKRTSAVGRAVRNPILGTAPRRAAYGARAAEERGARFGGRGGAEERGGSRFGGRGAEERGSRSGGRGAEERGSRFGGRGGAEERGGPRSGRGAEERGSRFGGRGGAEERGGSRSGGRGAEERGSRFGGRGAAEERGSRVGGRGAAVERGSRFGGRAAEERGARFGGRGGAEEGGPRFGREAPSRSGDDWSWGDIADVGSEGGDTRGASRGRSRGAAAGGRSGPGREREGRGFPGEAGRTRERRGASGRGSEGAGARPRGERPARGRGERTARPRTGGAAPRRPGGRGGPGGRSR
jgi:23S rRNA pseudouridine2605 synthase